MQKILHGLRTLFRFHKLKFVIVLFSALFFALLIFPSSDLTDLMTVKVSDLTQNRVYMQADRLGFSFLPSLGLRMENVVVEAAGLPTIAANSILLSPSLLSLITGSPAFSARAEGLFKGDVDLAVSGGEKTKNGDRMQKIDFTAENLGLNLVSNLLRDMGIADLKMQGVLGANAQLAVDPTGGEQPKGPLGISISRLVFPARVSDMGMGPIAIPEVRLQQLVLKGHMGEGRFTIEDASLGEAKDDLYGKIKGDLNVVVSNRGGTLAPEVNGYDLRVDLTVRSDFQERAKLFLLILDNYKQPVAGGVHYAFRVQTNNVNMPPRFSAP
jgi:type II secretion system protein N